MGRAGRPPTLDAGGTLVWLLFLSFHFTPPKIAVAISSIDISASCWELQFLLKEVGKPGKLEEWQAETYGCASP